MTHRNSRVVAVGAAALLGATALAAGPAQAKNDIDKPNPSANVSVQLLSFNDYHGHLEAKNNETGPLEGKDVGGAEFLSAKLTELRAGHENTLTVAAGDNTVRVLPPLVIGEAEIEEFFDKLSAGTADFQPPEPA